MNKVIYPYPKKAMVKYHDTYRDGGTKTYRVINSDEIGLKFIYQDFRIKSTAKGKFYTAYPGTAEADEIIDSFITISNDGVD